MNSSHREAETAEKVHRQTALEYELAEKELQILENKLQKHIIKTELEKCQLFFYRFKLVF